MPRKTNRCTVIYLLSLSLCAFAAGCSDDHRGGFVGPGPGYWARLYDWSDPATWTDPSLWPDDKLRSFAYSASRGHPEFFQEDPNLGSRYYENTISVRMEADKWIELSTDIRDSALAWSERAAMASAYYRDLVSERETDKYFEFRRVYSESPTNVFLSRVHKASYLVRSMYDRLHPSPVIGAYGPRPVDVSNARELIEYMWANGKIVDAGRPLSRNIEESDTSVAEEIYFCYTIGGDWGICDTIVFGRANVSVNRETGEIHSNATELREVQGVCYE
jgi:hypothetical protein